MTPPASPPLGGFVPLVVAIVALAGTIVVEVSRRRGARKLSERVESQQSALAANAALQQKELEELKDDLAGRRAAADEARQVDDLMATYRNPLARSVHDLQSRLWNVTRGFRGGGDIEYYRTSTLYIVAEVFGWLEIIRQEIQFLDAGKGSSEARKAIAKLQDGFASTTDLGQEDAFYLYRVQQRAIGELMIIPRQTAGRPGPSRECIGYAAFIDRLEDPTFARWFDRFGEALASLEYRAVPWRLAYIQGAAVDVLNILDPDGSRNPQHRSRIEKLDWQWDAGTPMPMPPSTEIVDDPLFDPDDDEEWLLPDP